MQGGAARAKTRAVAAWPLEGWRCLTRRGSPAIRSLDIFFAYTLPYK